MKRTVLAMLLASCGHDAAPRTEDSLAKCSDAIDNDRDGHVDCDDQDCAFLAMCVGGDSDSDTDADTDVDSDSDTDGDCVAPLVDCSGECVEIWIDPRHCGGCDSACDDLDRAPDCDSGDCFCGSEKRACEGTPQDRCCSNGGSNDCRNTLIDDRHCGGCGVVCELAEACVDGVCTSGY